MALRAARRVADGHDKQLVATIVVSTKNRKDDLRVALGSCVSQVGEVELIVIDDGSTDGTAEMVAIEFPRALVIRRDFSGGYIAARNQGAGVAKGDVIFSIDDDARFTSPYVVTQTLADFNDPRIGAVAIPYSDVNRDGVERQRTPTTDGIFVTDRFVGTAHAVRRDVFLGLGGYREAFFHQGEESDYCIRMLDAGYFVRLGSADRIDHFESPKRDTRRMDIYGRRNDVLFAVLNVPWPWLPLHLLSVTLKGLWFGVRVGRPLRMLRGVCIGYIDAIRNWQERRAVSVATYRLFRRLRKEGMGEVGSGQ